MSQKQKIFFILIVLIAVFFRFYQITVMPGGLFPDEAANGLDINSMQNGELQPFYERGNGREALFFYMLWGSIEILGKGVWQHHIVSALVGTFSVVVCFFVTRRLFLIRKKDSASTDTGQNLTGSWYENLKFKDQQSYNTTRATNIALLASFLMAANSWHVVLSRTAFRANLIPLFAGLTIYFLLKTYQTLASDEEKHRPYHKHRVYGFAFLTGASFALGFYTYIAYRILVLIIGFAILWPWLFNGLFSQVKRFSKPFFWAVLAFVIFIFPLAKYFYDNPDAFVGRSGQVSVFNQELYLVNGEQLKGKPEINTVLSAVYEVAEKSLSGFFISGDLNWRHNISGWPFLSQLVSPFFGFGLLCVTLGAVIYLVRPKKYWYLWKYFLLAGWFWGMLVPVITTAEGIPHGLRSIGMIPPVFIISAWALYSFANFIWRWHNQVWAKSERCHLPHFESLGLLLKRKITTYRIKFTVALFFLAIVLQTYFGYFIYAANSAENFYYFRSDLTYITKYLLERCEKKSTYLVLDKFSVQTTDYLSSDPKGDFNSACNVPYRQVDPENVWQLTNLIKGDQVVFAQSSIFDIKKFRQYHPDAYLKMELRNKFGQAIMAVYEINSP